MDIGFGRGKDRKKGCRIVGLQGATGIHSQSQSHSDSVSKKNDKQKENVNEQLALPIILLSYDPIILPAFLLNFAPCPTTPSSSALAMAFASCINTCRAKWRTAD